MAPGARCPRTNRRPAPEIELALMCCAARWPCGLGGMMLSLAGTRENSMSKAGLDNRHRNHDGEISPKHANTLIRTLRKIYGQSFAAGYPDTEKLSDVLPQLNETTPPRS